jgi:hypothetical protein
MIAGKNVYDMKLEGPGDVIPLFTFLGCLCTLGQGLTFVRANPNGDCAI